MTIRAAATIPATITLTYPNAKCTLAEPRRIEAGAPGSCYGDLCAEPPYSTVAEIDPLRQALESVYYDWWGENDYLLSMGLPGDVLELRERLNAAFAKASSCSLVTPREA
jgi:hypothetical protein